MKFKSPYDEDREVPALGRIVEVGEVVEVPESLAESFLAAGWEGVTGTPPPAPPTPAPTPPEVNTPPDLFDNDEEQS